MKTMTARIYEGLLKIRPKFWPDLGDKLAALYARLANPVNYGIIGGIGVGINYLVFLLLIGRLPWWFTNFLAILAAWSWNWSMSVGPFGWLWGFKKRTESLK